MTHVITSQPIGNADDPPAYSTVMNEKPPEFDSVIPAGNAVQPTTNNKLRRSAARNDPVHAVNVCCCYIDDDADFLCIGFVRCIAGMFHGMGVCLDGCLDGCANWINGCCNDKGCCSCCEGDAVDGDVPDPGDCDCSGCDCSDCDCSGCDCDCFS